MADAQDTDHHHGSLAHPHEGGEAGIRGGKMIHDQGDEGEVAIVSCGTTKGNFVAKLHHDWSPHGYDRATALFQKGFYDHSHFFRVVPKYLVQFGISYTDNKSLLQFSNTPVPDDPQLDPRITFRKGTMSFAGSGPNSRTSQLFISYGAHAALGRELWETPFGEIIEGMEHIEEFYSYGDMPPWGKGPVQGKIHQDPNYIPNEFPLVDKFETCTVIVQKPGDKDPDTTGEEEGEGKAEEGVGDDKGASGEELDEPPDAEEEEEEEGAVGRGEVHEQRPHGLEHDQPKKMKLGQRQLEIAKETLGPFADFLQIGLVVVGIIVMVMGAAALSRRGRKKKHVH